MPADLFGAAAATVDRHPIFELDASSCTPQRGQLGPWSTRLPHFRMDATPSSGDELQSEYFVPRQHAVDAINVVRAMAARLTPLLKVSEIRTVAADRLWLSPEYGRDSVGLHFTWQVDQPAVEALLVELEAALAPFGARPHWGKLFAARASEIAALYERLPDFLALLERVDPRGAFRNDWFAARVAG
jgi:xylitol oxidase